MLAADNMLPSYQVCHYLGLTHYHPIKSHLHIRALTGRHIGVNLATEILQAGARRD